MSTIYADNCNHFYMQYMPNGQYSSLSGLPTPVVVLAIAVRYHFYFIGEFSDSNSPLYEHIYA